MKLYSALTLVALSSCSVFETINAQQENWNLNENDAQAWIQLRNDLDFRSWYQCRDPKTDPCSIYCSLVRCETKQNEVFITRIELQGNNIKNKAIKASTLRSLTLMNP